MSAYETSTPVQATDESDTAITVVFPNATYSSSNEQRSETVRSVDPGSGATITVVFPNATYSITTLTAQDPTEGHGLQEIGPSNPSELVTSSYMNVQPVDESETSITMVFPNVAYTFTKPYAQMPTEGHGLQETGPSSSSELS